MGLSVAIVAMNEEANIGRTLESVRWADEIILVDSGSTDRTCDIARQYGARVIVEPWRGYTAQKNYALEFCTQDWVLALDADEEVSPGLAEEIRQVISGNGNLRGYLIPRRNLFLGKWLRFGGFYPDPKLRLFRRGQAHVTGADPHDRVELTEGNPPRAGRLTNPMLHYAYPTLSLYINHMNRYSTLMAQTIAAKRRHHLSLGNTVLRPLGQFIYNYFFRLGFLDGKRGLLLHLYHAAYVSWKYTKAWEESKRSS
ncbi:MAG: glycosyltransferase family 2 protein [Terriglobales bacterium]